MFQALSYFSSTHFLFFVILRCFFVFIFNAAQEKVFVIFLDESVFCPPLRFLIEPFTHQIMNDHRRLWALEPDGRSTMQNISKIVAHCTRWSEIRVGPARLNFKS